METQSQATLLFHWLNLLRQHGRPKNIINHYCLTWIFFPLLRYSNITRQEAHRIRPHTLDLDLAIRNWVESLKLVGTCSSESSEFGVDMIKRTCPQSPAQKHGRVQRRWEKATQPTSRAPASEKWYGFERWNKNHWALSFLRWLSFLPPGVKGNHETILRLRKFGKPASRTQDKKFPVDVSCGVPGIYFCSLKLHSVQRKQAALNGLCDRQKDSTFPMLCGFRWHLSHSLEFTNSPHSLRPGSLASTGNISSLILPAEAWSRSALIITIFREIQWFMERS